MKPSSHFGKNHLALSTLLLVACLSLHTGASAQTVWSDVVIFKVESEQDISLMPAKKLCGTTAIGAFLDLNSNPPIPTIVVPANGRFELIKASVPKDRPKKSDLTEKYERMDDHAGSSWPLMQMTGEVYLARFTDLPFKRIKLVHSFEAFELNAVGCSANAGTAPVIYSRHAKARDNELAQYVGLVTVDTGELREISTIPVGFGSAISWLGPNHLAIFGSWLRGNNWAVLGLNGKVLKMGGTQGSPAWLLQANGTLSSINVTNNSTPSIQVTCLFGKER